MSYKKYVLGCIFTLLILACSSPTQSIYSSDTTDLYDSQADLAAYAAHHFTYIKEQPDRSPERPLEFYYKRCSQNGESSFYSKTAYDCTLP